MVKININLQSFMTKMIIFIVIIPSFFMLTINIINGVVLSSDITTLTEQDIKKTGDQIYSLIEQADINLEESYRTANQTFDELLRDQVYSLYSDIEFYYEEVQEGRLTTLEAQTLAKNLTNNKRYGEDLTQYFWIYNSTHHSIAHGTHPERYGLSYADSQTAIDFVDQALHSTEKQGYVYYAQVGTDVLKKAFVKGFEPWGWAICTGTTLQSIEDEFSLLKETTLTELRETINNVETLDGGYIAILNSSASIIYHPTTSLIGTQLDTIDEITGRPLGEIVLENTGDFIEYTFNNDRKTMYITHLEGDYFDFFICSTVPQSTITNSVQEITNILYILMAVSVTVLIIIGSFFSRNLSRPISTLTGQAQSIANHNYDIDVKIARKDEIGKLSTALSEMVDNIKGQIEYNRAIIDTSPNPQILLNKEYKILDVNSKTIKITGISKEKLLNQPVSTVFLDLKEYELAADQIRKNGRLESFQMSPKTKDGSQMRMLLNIEKMQDNEGNFLGNLLTFTDITSIINLVRNISLIAEEVSSMANQMSESTNQINITVQEVTTNAQNVSEGAQNQTFAVNNISSEIIKVQKGSQKMVENTRIIAKDSKSGQEMAQNGKKLTNDLTIRIAEINEGAEKVAVVMSSLAEKSNEINKIVDVISGIATETNLLALNAAIEAARAGDAGKGFAVVAEQVRKLAEDSKQAADQINNLINLIQTEVTEAVGATENTVFQVKDGKEAIEGTAKQLDALFKVINNTDAGIQETIRAIENSDLNIQNIAMNIEQINDVIQQSSDASEELSSSTEEIASTLEEMGAGSEELNAAAERLFIEVRKI